MLFVTSKTCVLCFPEGVSTPRVKVVPIGACVQGKAFPGESGAGRYIQGENENYEIAQYSAKSHELPGVKIAQFPNGSRFIMADGIPESEEQRTLDGSVRDLLEQHGMVVERDHH